MTDIRTGEAIALKNMTAVTQVGGRRLARHLALGASLAAVAMAAPAQAQIEEIVVTANKVEENVQDVPIAVTAVSGEALDAAGVTGLETLSDIAPSITFRKGTTGANNALFLRGVGTITFAIAAEPSVSTVVDGIVLSRSGQAFSDLADIERIEVLRGPQGTLFGKNASAGLINIVSKGGTNDFEGELNIGAYEGDEYRTKISLSGPLSETLKARVTGFYGSYAGNITNIFAGQNRKVNGYKRKGLRGVLDWEAGAGAKIRLIADYYDADDDCCAEITGVSRGAVIDAELGLPGGVALGENQRFVNHNLVTRSVDKQWGLTAQGDFDVLSDHTLTIVTGYRDWRNDETREGDYVPRAIVGTNEFHDQGTVETQQYSAEIRLASDQSKAFVYQVGAFYWRSDNSQDFTRRVVSCATTTLPTDPITGARPCNPADTVNTIFPTATSRSDVSVENYALFGQATYKFTDALRLTAGLRWTHDAIDYVHNRAPGINARTGLPLTSNFGGISNTGAGGTIAGGGNGTNISAGSLSNDNISGKVVFQADLSDKIMSYASYTRGYKGPAFNIFFNHVRPTNSIPIDEETSDAYEIGLKSRFLDNRVQLNIAAFQADYKGFQANNFVLLNGVPVTNLTNAGSIRTKGFELEAVANPADGWTLGLNVANTDAKVTKFNPNPLTNAPDARNGTRLPLAPKWAWSVSSDYERSLDGLGLPLMLYFRTSYNYVGKQFSELGNVGALDSYGQWNASIGFSDADDKYRLTFHARNISDESYISLNTSNGQRLHIPRDADRYFGATLRVGFGG